MCLCLLKDPHLIDCECGASFCHTCIEPIKEEGKACPLCKGPFTTSIPDRRLQRTLSNLKVYCSNKDAGCDWSDTLGKLPVHLNVADSDSDKLDGCLFERVPCSYCTATLQRRRIKEHEMKRCPRRPFLCVHCKKYQSSFQDVTDKHIPVCPAQIVECPHKCGVKMERRYIESHSLDDCPLYEIDCTFLYAGCEVRLPRKDMPAHIADSLAIHMSLQQETLLRELGEVKAELKIQRTEHNQLTELLKISNLRIEELENEVEALKSEQLAVRTHFRVTPLHFFVTDFSSKKRNRKVWNSPPFYTHLQGYKLCLDIHANGIGNGEGTHISVYVHMMRGEFDSQLKWPFQGSVVIQLLSQEEYDDIKVSTEINFDQILHLGAGLRVTRENIDEGWGRPEFIAHNDLWPKYLKNDTLYFKVLSYV